MTQVIQGSGLPRIKSASSTRSAEEITQQLAAELLTIMDHVKGTPEEKLHHAKRILGALLRTHGSNLSKLKVGTRNFALRQALGLIDSMGLQKTYPSTSGDVNQRSYTKTNAAPNLSEIKLPKPSSYQSFSECVSDISGRFQLGDDIASEYCRALNTDATKGGVKSASSTKSDIPKWAFAMGDGYWTGAAPESSPSIKSASAPSEEYLRIIHNVSAADTLRDRAERRSEAREEHRLLSASKKGIPAWALVSGGLD